MLKRLALALLVFALSDPPRRPWLVDVHAPGGRYVESVVVRAWNPRKGYALGQVMIVDQRCGRYETVLAYPVGCSFEVR